MDYNDDACFNWFSEPEDSLMKENFFLNTCSFKNNNILIVGLGKSGIACVNYLSKQIEYKKKLFKISVYDKKKSIKEQKDLLKKFDIENFFTSDLKKEILTGRSHIFLSPGVNPTEVNKFNLPLKIINDISLFQEHLADNSNDLKVIGVTGTNGKTTTCLFLEHLLLKAGYKAKAAGNLGYSPLSLVDKLKELDVLVIEISSFQLNPFKKNGLPGKKIDIGVFLNFTEDHLDVHEDMEDYLQSKIALLKSSKRKVINNKILKYLPNKFKDITFNHSNKKNTEQLELENLSSDGYIIKALPNNKFIMISKGFEINIDTNKLMGEHNVLNIAAAFAAFRILNLTFTDYQDVVRSFRGLPHRIEWVREINNINFYNDSKATNVASTVAALEVFRSKNVFLIAGGDSKKLPLAPLKKYLTKNVSHLFLIGQDALKIQNFFKNLDMLKIFMCDDLANAVNEAFNLAKSGDIILLSPSCSSHDVYKNFIERGEHFKEVVHTLKK